MESSLPSYYVDGYALFRILHGHPRFKEYATSVAMLTSKHDLQRMHALLLKREGRGVADQYFDAFLPHAIPIDDAIYKQANGLGSKRLPATDLLGWLTARTRNIPYLTADRRFRGKEGVILR
ncbi:MAG: hypothetical protein GXP63_03645 [DPANN group archaeon]|nr:hypothetical protein [DPANN group archaeon]